jgi:Glucodextranase, domain B
MMNRACLLIVIAACGNATTAPDQPTSPPVLIITAPARGTNVDGASVTVSGTATVSSGAPTVTINSAGVAVGSDGSFSADVEVAPGISLIETHAIDETGSDTRDVRAVLAGTLATSDGSEQATIAAEASPAALTAIGGAIATDAKAIDFTQAAQALNPVYDNSGCLGAVIDITSIALKDIDVALAPKANALATEVTIDNVTVKLSASYKVACIGGSTTITVGATAAHISGDLGASISGGKIATTLPSATVTLDGFTLDVGSLPSELTDLVTGAVKSAVQNSLASMIQSKVPALANQKLAGLVAKSFSGKILGQTTALTVTPSKSTIASTGLYVELGAKALVTGGAGGMYYSAPMPASPSLMAQSQDLGVAVECDLVNSLLAGLWAAGAFDKTVPVSDLSLASALLDPNATQLALSLSLPPTVTSDGTGDLQLAMGDAMISIEDAGGTQLQQLALSLQTAVSAASMNGSVALTLGTPTVFATITEQADDGARALSDSEVETLVGGVWPIIGGQASSALANLPLPQIAGVTLGAPTVSGAPGYLVANLPLH